MPMASQIPNCAVSTKIIAFADSAVLLAASVVTPAVNADVRTVATTALPVIPVLPVPVAAVAKPSPGISTTQAMSPGAQPAVLPTVNVR